MAFLETTMYGNSLTTWAIAAAIAVACFFLLGIVSRVLRGRLAAIANRTATDWDDLVVQALGRTKSAFLLVLALYAGTRALDLPPRLSRVVEAITVLALLLQGGIWLSAALTSWLAGYTKRELQQDRGAATTVSAMGFVGKLVLWVVIVLVALDNVGVNITTLVAGLGVGGVAVALAVQNVLGDLFASLSIILDKPFVLGDFVVVDDQPGTVERVGLKTTRVRSLWGEQVIFSNSDLLKSRLRNFGRMFERRIMFGLGVTYQTPRDKLRLIPTIVRQAVEAQPKTRFDRSHFKSYGASSLDFESVYYVLSPDYNTYMDTQQAVNLQIHERFEKEGIEFAYPTQTVYLVQQSAV